MAPGSKAHTLIKSNARLALAQSLRGTGCRALVDGAIVEIEGSSLIPDVVVTCSELDFATPRVADPVLIVEVLSPWSEKDDSGRKLALYLKIPSLHHYLVIEQDRRQIVYHELDPGIELSLAALYEGVPVDPRELGLSRA